MINIAVKKQCCWWAVTQRSVNRRPSIYGATICDTSSVRFCKYRHFRNWSENVVLVVWAVFDISSSSECQPRFWHLFPQLNFWELPSILVTHAAVLWCHCFGNCMFPQLRWESSCDSCPLLCPNWISALSLCPVCWMFHWYPINRFPRTEAESSIRLLFICSFLKSLGTDQCFATLTNLIVLSESSLWGYTLSASLRNISVTTQHFECLFVPRVEMYASTLSVAVTTSSQLSTGTPSWSNPLAKISGTWGRCCRSRFAA